MTDLQAQLALLAQQPGDPGAISLIASAYAAEGRWEELLRVYEDNALRSATQTAVPLLRRAADICVGELASAQRAETYLRRALDLSPTDVETLGSLRQIYMARGEYERGVEIFEKEIARTTDTKAKVLGLVETARIYRDHLGRIEKALAALRLAQRTDATDPHVHEMLAEIHLAQGRIEQAHSALMQELAVGGPDKDRLDRLGRVAEQLLARPKLHDLARTAIEAILRHRADDATSLRVKHELDAYRNNWSQHVLNLAEKASYLGTNDRVQAAEVWLSIAEIQIVYGQQNDAALASIDKALAARPGHPVALKLLEEIYGAEDRFEDLALKLEMMAAYVREPQVAVELYLKAAMHYAVRLDNPESASRIYQRVLELDPGNKVASNALVEFYRERRAWEPAVAVLAGWAERATQSGEKVAAHYAICRILEEELGDKTRARPHYEAILALDPENQAAARALEAVYRQAGDHAALARTLRAKLAGLADADRAAVLRELGELYVGPLGDRAGALEVLGDLFQIEPSAKLCERLEELAAAQGAFAALVQILEGGLDRISAPEERVHVLHSVAALYEGAHDAPREALRIHRRILALDANDDRARTALDRLLQAVAETGDKITFYQEQLQAAGSKAERVTVLHRLGAELVDTAKDYVRAIDVYREVLKVSPKDTAALDRLLSLYRRDNRWAEVAEVLETKLGGAGAREAKERLQLELAEILEMRLEEVDRAIDLYAAVLDAAPGHPGAVSGLERGLGKTRAVDRIVTRLQPYYEQQGNWLRVVDMMEVRIRESVDATVRTRLLRELATIYEQRLDKRADALGTLLRLFQASPSDELQPELERLAGAIGDNRGVVRAYRAAGLTVEGDGRVKLLMRAAALAEQGADRMGAAVDYLRVMGLGDEVTAKALEGLRRVTSSGLEVDKLREAARHVAEGLEDPQRDAFLRTLAPFYEREMNSPTDAIAAWKAILDRHHNDPQAMAELERLYETAGDAGQLVEHLRAKLADAPDDTTRAAIGGQIAEIVAAQLGDIGSAITELTRVGEIAPGQPLVWQRLGELQERAGQYPEAAESLHREIGLLADGAERRERLVRYARMLAERLGQGEAALAALQGVLSQEPTHTSAVDLLESMFVDPAAQGHRDIVARALLGAYRAAERWAELARLQGTLVDYTADPSARVALLKEMSALKAQRLGDAAGAYADLERAFRDGPLDADLRGQLELLAEKAGAQAKLIDAYTASLGAIADANAQRPIRQKLAQLLERVGRADEAVEHYRAAFGGELPADLASLEAMERLLRSQNRFAELVDVLSRMLTLVPATDVARRKAMLTDIGALSADELMDKARAVEAYRALAEIDAQAPQPLRQLDKLLGELGQASERIDVLRRLTALGPANPQLVEDYVVLADLSVQAGNIDDAVASYRAVLLKKRDHAAALEGLERLLAQAENKQDIAQILEPIYTTKQDHTKLAWVLEARVDSTPDLAQRKGLLRRIGDIYENRLQQKDRAFAMARRSLGEDPADMGVRMWIEKLASETGAMRELADAYVQEAARGEAQLKLQFLRRAAALYHQKLEDMAAAVSAYQEILDLEPRDEKALAGLESIHRATEAYPDLVAVLRRRMEMTAGVERKREYLGEIATLQVERLGDATAAVLTYRELLAMSPDDVTAFSQVERLVAELGRWDELARFYDAEIDRLKEKRGRDSQARRLEMMYRRGRVIYEQFGEPQKAMEVFALVLAEDPAHASSIPYLEAQAAAGGLEAIELLENVYKTQKQWQKYVALLGAKLNQTAESDRRRQIYLELAATYDTQLAAGDMAFMAVSRAYSENRADLELLDRLEQLVAKYEQWEELVAVLSTDLDSVADPRLRQDLLHRLGEITDKLGDAQRAIAYLQRALEYEPRDDKALSGLDALMTRHEMWAALAEILERRIEVASEPGAKSVLLERLASVWGDKLMDAEAALRCHKQILEIDPDHPITLKSMQKLYAELSDWDSLAKNLSRQAEVLTDPSDQVRVHAAAGELYAEELGDMSEAIAHWQKVVEIESTHEAANQALDVLLSAEERWEELAEHYRRQLAHTRDVGAKSEINRRLGMILGEKLGRTDDALSSWLEVIKTNPKNVDALRALLGLYNERAMWTEFVDAARRLIPLVEPAEAKDVRFQLARACGENLGQRDDAIKLAREVRATEPHTVEALVRLGDMLQNIEAFDEAVITLEKAAALQEDAAQRVALYYRAAGLHEEQLGKPNDARGCYEAILAAAPDDGRAYAALAVIYRATGEWRKLVALDEEFVPHATSADRLAILREIRDTHAEKLGEKELAFITACRVYKENPEDLEAAEVLENLGVETEGAEEMVAVLEDELEAIVTSEVKIASLRRIARIYGDLLKDAPQAEATLRKILDIEPSDLEALDSLAILGAREDRFDKQIAALEEKLGRVGEDTARKSILFEMARIWEDRIGEIDDAVGALQRVLEIDGSDVTALDALARIYTEQSRWSELAHTLTRKVELTQDPSDSVQLRLRVAGLCESELADPETAIHWYRGVLDFEAGHAGALAALERLYTGLERWSELIGVFETQLAKSSDNEEKIRILAKMAAIYESEFDSPRDAALCYERVGQIDATHMPSLKNLERLLRQLGEWNRLIEVLNHHITLLEDAQETTPVYLEIGEIYYKELTRVDKAEEIYNRARELNPDSTDALHALGQLYERSGNWFQSLEMLQREADALRDDPRAVPLLLRIGKINEDMLMDIGAAKAAYERALDIDSTYGPALQAMKEIARSAEDWDAYAEHLITEAETAEDPEEKTELYYEAAKFYQDVRGDEQSATQFYQRAIETSAGHVDSARQLAELYFRGEQWAEAGNLYRIVREKIDKAKDPKDYCQKSYRLGYISEKEGEGELALEYYRQAFEADATYLPALEGLGQALLAAQRWDEAQKVFQTILIHHRDALTESEIVDLQWQLGDLGLRQGQQERAYKQFDKALEIDPDHGPSLRALATLDQQAGNYQQAFERLGRLADVVASAERGDVLMEMSRIANEQLRDPARAVEALERARRMERPPVELLEDLANLYVQGKQPQKAMEVLEQAVDVATEPAQVAELNFKLGSVLEHEIKHEPMAVQRYNAALDAMPTYVKAFEAVERILVARKEWGLLEQNYRAMIARSKDLSQQVRLVLWRNLAELYARVLQQPDAAIMAYEVIRKMEPDKPQDSSMLAELYAQKPEHRDKAIEMFHAALPTLENPVEPIRKLRQLYHAGRDFDAVYVLCSALVFLREAGEEERKIFEYLQQGVPQRATQGMIEDQWKVILHPGLLGPIGALAATLYRGAPDFFTVPERDLGLRKKDQIDVRQSELYFANMMRYVGKLLNLQGIDLFKKAGSMEPLRLLHTQPPALVAGENNDIFRESAQRVVLYHIGRNLAYARPEMFLSRVHPGDELRDLLFGLCVVYNRSLGHNGDPREVERWAQVFERLPPPALKRLQPLARDAYAELMKGKPLAEYTDAVEVTAARAGLLAAGDLTAAVRGVTEGGEGASRSPVRTRVKDLVLFAVSRAHLDLRRALGGAIVEQRQSASG